MSVFICLYSNVSSWADPERGQEVRTPRFKITMATDVSEIIVRTTLKKCLVELLFEGGQCVVDEVKR